MPISIRGGGMFGRIIGQYLRSRGESVKIYDLGLPGSGLAAAGCLIKPSWVQRVPHRDRCLELLYNLFGLQVVDFEIAGIRTKWDPVYVLNKRAVMDVEITKDRVVHPDIICVGGWGNFQKPRWGAAYTASGSVTPKIRMWRPFTHLARFEQFPGLIWSGDGTAVTYWGEKYDTQTRERCQSFVGRSYMTQILGRRPYALEKTPDPCDIRRVESCVEVTGGGKNGAIAAAWAALKITGEIS